MRRVDYSTYSIEELLEVKQNIDPTSENYPALVAQIEKREGEISVSEKNKPESHLNLAINRVKAIGYLQLAAAAIIPTMIFMSGDVSTGTAVITILLTLLNLIAGYTAVNALTRFYWISILNQSLQVVSFGIGNTVLNYSGLGGINLKVTLAEVSSFGFAIQFNPGFSYVKYTGQIAEQFITIDVLGVIFIGALVSTGFWKKFDKREISD